MGRLRKKHEFKAVFEQGTCFVNQSVVVYALRNNMGVSRVGLSVSRKIGKAVKRNWVKRRLREAVKSVLVMDNNHYDVVLLARKPIIHSKYKDIVSVLQNSIEKIVYNEAISNSLS